MNLREYINKYYDGDSKWFVQFTTGYDNHERIANIINIKEYLSGKHAILNKSKEMWNGKEFHPRTIVLNYANVRANP